ncbi:EBP domain-containing protein [Xylona heveae TC161]|uniref:EBP domain-containing protein n=1 Tax=Xylona heveae (strain CBS 132557 / TC161) TaxID=1328760 RepID=A0A165HXZ2_XYLHT|nr:EBP domain-containing protein [Xylona heveae TC161]KZF24081.1 EBP domain-containing protein [Xylona heveae TC161]
MEAIANITRLETPVHPYYPLEIQIVGYVANQLSVPHLLVSFAAGCAAIFSITTVIVTKIRPHLPRSELLTVLWFVLSGCIHLFFEGYYVLNHTRMGGQMDLFGQLWKEYSLSDSRYLTSDPFVLCMETITAAAWGPLSFLVAALITTESPLRYPLQAIVSLGQLYGDVLYYTTSMFDHFHKGLSYCRPESYYFWGYYFFMNTFWIIIPLVLLYNSVTATARAFKIAEQTAGKTRQKKLN